MKSTLIILFFSIINALSLNAQSDFPETHSPIYLPVGANKTTVLILPSAITDIDRGNNMLMAKIVKSMNNVLKIKYARDTNITTNLHLFTADRKVYNFVTFYDYDPTDCTWDFNQSAAKNTEIPSTKFHFPSSKKTGGIKLNPTGVFTGNGNIFIRFNINNKSAIPFCIDFSRFIIKDNKTTKRTSICEKEIIPVSGYPLLPGPIKPSGSQEFILAFDQFTITSKKHLSIELFEKNGDRHLTYRISGRRLLRARPLNH